MNDNGFALEVQKKDLSTTQWTVLPATNLHDGEIECRVDITALTANNVTYGAVGDEVGYWHFYPGSAPGWGRIPVWGFAEVSASRHDGVSDGERLYGYWPMATKVVLRPGKLGARGFTDDTPHRRELPAVYNQYVRVPASTANIEAMQALFRPLFITSFLIDDFIADSDGFGAEQVVISSASSKTAYGTAFCLREREGFNVVGLTSERNAEFVKNLGCYDAVRTYEDVSDLATAPAVYVDIAGNTDLRARLHDHFADALKYSCAVGYSHLGTMERGRKLAGPKPEFFFAPARVAKRNKDWADSGGLLGHYARAEQAFLPFAERNTQCIDHRGRDGIEKAFTAMVDNACGPNEGHILHWQSA